MLHGPVPRTSCPTKCEIPLLLYLLSTLHFLTQKDSSKLTVLRPSSPKWDGPLALTPKSENTAVKQKTKGLTTLIRQTDCSSSLLWMWSTCLCFLWAQVLHTDLWNAPHGRHEELRHIHRDLCLNCAVPPMVIIRPGGTQLINKHVLLKANGSV